MLLQLKVLSSIQSGLSILNTIISASIITVMLKLLMPFSLNNLLINSKNNLLIVLLTLSRIFNVKSVSENVDDAPIRVQKCSRCKNSGHSKRTYKEQI